MSEYNNLIIDRVGTNERVGRITLDRPEKLNALSQELLYEFWDALHDMEADSSVRTIIVRGAGRAFSAGYDLTPARGGRQGAAACSWAYAWACSRSRTFTCTSGTWPRSRSPRSTGTPSSGAANSR